MGSVLLPWSAGAKGKKVQEHFQCTCWASHWEASTLFPCSGREQVELLLKYKVNTIFGSIYLPCFPTDFHMTSFLWVSMAVWTQAHMFCLISIQGDAETIHTQPLRAWSAQQQACIWQVSLNLLLPAAVEKILVPEFITLLLSLGFTWSLKINEWI